MDKRLTIDHTDTRRAAGFRMKRFYEENVVKCFFEAFDAVTCKMSSFHQNWADGSQLLGLLFNAF